MTRPESGPATAATPAVTLRSIMVAFLGLLVAAVLNHVIGVYNGMTGSVGLEALPSTALMVTGLLFSANGVASLVWRRRLLEVPEMVFVLAVVFIATPLFGHGFWRRSLTVAVTAASNSDIDRYDMVPRNFWPAGDDVLAGVFADPERPRVAGPVERVQVTHSRGQAGWGYVMDTGADSAEASLRVRVPLRTAEQPGLHTGRDYLFLVLARAEFLAPRAEYGVRIFTDRSEETLAVPVASRQTARPRYVQPEGFIRQGRYGVRVEPDQAEAFVEVEFWLRGQGRVTFVEPEWIDVSAIEMAYAGRRSVTRAVWLSLPVHERENYTILPDRWWSWDGLRYLVQGHVPWKPWLRPLVLYGGWMLLISTASLALVLLLRRQWMDNERFPQPVDQPLFMLFAPEEGQPRAWPPILRHPLMWAGVGMALVWYAFVAASMMNPAFINPQAGVTVASYISGSEWGETWKFPLSLSLILIAFGLFMEIHVLASLVVGFFLFRLQYLIGQHTGWSIDQSYPYPAHQTLGAMLGYGLVSFVLVWRYLGATVREALGRVVPDPGQGSSRTAYGLLLVVILLVLVWARWAALPVGPALGLFAMFVLFYFAAARLRAECGIVTGLTLFILPMSAVASGLGGVEWWGVATVAFGGLIVLMIGQNGVMLLPGLQATFVQLGHQQRLSRAAVIIAGVSGVGLALILGGYVFLNGIYGTGAINQVAIGDFYQYQDLVLKLAVEVQHLPAGPGMAATGSGAAAPGNALAFGALGAGGLAGLRQFFAGLWFHPIGFILAPVAARYPIIGSILVALVLRWVVLRLGGAVTIREKLLPFACGLVFGSVAAFAVIALFNVWLGLNEPGAMRLFTV